MIFLFYSDHKTISLNFVIILTNVISNMNFTFEQEKNGKLSFLDVEVSRDGNTFVTSVYRKPTFSGVYTHFDSFLPSTYKIGMI